MPLSRVLLSWPFDPRKHHRFVVLGLNGATEIGDLAVGDIIAPAFQDAGRAIFHEDRVAAVGVLDEFVLVGRGYGHDEAIDVGHGILLWIAGACGCRVHLFTTTNGLAAVRHARNPR
jgi:hypothetical protein